MRIPVLVIVDSGLSAAAGHHLNTTRHFAGAALDAAWRVCVCAPQDCDVTAEQIHDDVRLFPCLTCGLYSGWDTAGGKRETTARELYECLGNNVPAGADPDPDCLLLFHTGTLLQAVVAVDLLWHYFTGANVRARVLFRNEPGSEPEPLPGGIDTQLHERIRVLVERGRLEFLAETPPLAEEYAGFLDVHCRPLPHITGRVEHSRPPRRNEVPVLGYFGESRTDKGFHLLPDLAARFAGPEAAPAARFFIQVSSQHADTMVVDAVNRLRDLCERCPGVVELYERELPEDEYWRKIRACDALLLPYDRGGYRRRGSGLAVDAVVTGKPLLVPSGTWMAGMTAWGNGMLWQPGESLAAAVETLLNNLAELQCWAQAAAPLARARHDPKAVFDRLVNG